MTTPLRRRASRVTLATLALVLAPLVFSEAPTRDLPPCPTEDSQNCRWDAGARGNGLGESFDAYADGACTLVRYDNGRIERFC